MDGQNNKNLILAMVLSMLVIMVWMVLFPPPEAVVDPNAAVTPEGQAVLPPATAPAAAVDTDPTAAEALPEAARLTIDTPSLAGSISLRGGRIDDLRLKTYRETLDPASPEVTLLSPVGTEDAFYALYGWAPGAGLTYDDLPGPNSEWKTSSGRLAPGNPVVLNWDNGKGLIFKREIAVDDKFMFTITDSVQNSGAAAVSLQPYGLLRRHGLPGDLQKIFVVHEGVVGRADGIVTEMDYGDVADLPVIEREQAAAEVSEATTDGWIGFTDHYWMAVLVPEQGKPHTQVTKYAAASDIYQTEVRQPVMAVAPGATVSATSQLFAGAKEWETITTYQNQPGAMARLFGDKVDEANAPIPGFVESIDWGWFSFLTKPIFAVLHWLHGLIGNMGLAIIALTFVLKVIVLPLAYKSYVSMARMKELQPEMEALKERAGEDKQKLQKEMMQLYREKKVNPAAGCLPILIQIPIFFSLYKVIFVTIELRQAPFFGWIKDLSLPDSSSLYNLFGALPWDAPSHGTIAALIFIGVLPILLGITMWLQQKLNPAPTDPIQASIFAWMPWVFMFMLGGFASGLVVYWITNNVITFSQQYLIMWSHGKRPRIFDNMRKPVAVKVADKAPAPVVKKGRK